MYVNTFGTFGVASASFYLSRVGPAVGRLTHCLSGDTAQAWHPPVADEFRLDAGWLSRGAVVLLRPLCTLGGPVLLVKDSWRRHGRVGRVRDHAVELQYGISARRAEWFTKWTRDVHLRRRTGQDNVHGGCNGIRKTIPCSLVQIPESALMRLTRKLLSYVEFILRHLSNQVEREALLARDADAPREHISQGGGTGKRDQDGNRRMATSREQARCSRSLALALCRSNTGSLPWVHEKRGKPSLAISTLEALAVLVSLKMFHRKQPSFGRRT